jgi:hypothetical protein
MTRVKHALGEAKGLAQIAELVGLKKSTAAARLRKAHHGSACLFKPLQVHRKHGEWKALVERAAQIGLTEGGLRWRLRCGMTEEQALKRRPVKVSLAGTVPA